MMTRPEKKRYAAILERLLPRVCDRLGRNHYVLDEPSEARSAITEHATVFVEVGLDEAYDAAIELMAVCAKVIIDLNLDAEHLEDKGR